MVRACSYIATEMIKIAGLDHTDVLGSSISEIASHKAGIFKSRVPAFTSPQTPEALEVLVKEADAAHVCSVDVRSL